MNDNKNEAVDTSDELFKKYCWSLINGAVAIAAAIVIVLIINQPKPIEWPNSELANKLPPINSKRGEIISDGTNTFYVKIKKYSVSEFSSYVSACRKKGFFLYIEQSDNSFDAYDDDGYHLYITHSNSDELSITLNLEVIINELQWSTTELASAIPVINSPKGEMFVDDETKYSLKITNFTEEQYKKYLQECCAKGFIFDSEYEDTMYKAFNKSGDKLSLIYSKGILEIDLDAAIVMADITWPKNDVTKKIPKPESVFGKIIYDNDACFSVYIGNISKEQYQEYVEKCMKKGFKEDYSRSDTCFSAKNKKEYELTIEYLGFNTMQIYIEAPENN